MKKFNAKNWIKAAGLRAVRTAAQTAVSTIGVSLAMSDVNWGYVASCSALAGILSLLMSLKGLPELDDNGNIIEETDGEEEE